MANQKLTSDTWVEVINTSKCSVGYTPEMSKVARIWERQGATKKIKLGEIKEAMGNVGVYRFFNENILLIKNSQIREDLGLPELDEYTLEEDGMKELLLNGTHDKLEDFVQNCTDDMLDNIVLLAIELKLSDLNRIKIIEEYSGIAVLNAIREKEEEEKENPSKAKATTETGTKPKRAPRKKTE